MQEEIWPTKLAYVQRLMLKEREGKWEGAKKLQSGRSGQHAVPHVQTHATVALRCKWHLNSGSNDPMGSQLQDPAFSAPLLSITVQRVL